MQILREFPSICGTSLGGGALPGDTCKFLILLIKKITLFTR